jgi:hypothetical protein
MMKISLIALIGSVSLLSAPLVFADAASHAKAAEDLLVAASMEEVFTRTIDQALDAQIAANPQLAELKPVMKAFFDKHMSWAALKPDMVKLYTESFTEEELKDITKFYQTPSGKKMALTTPDLMAKGAAIGQAKVQAHMPELQQMVEAAMAEKAAGE